MLPLHHPGDPSSPYPYYVLQGLAISHRKRASSQVATTATQDQGRSKLQEQSISVGPSPAELVESEGDETAGSRVLKGEGRGKVFCKLSILRFLEGASEEFWDFSLIEEQVQEDTTNSIPISLPLPPSCRT